MRWKYGETIIIRHIAKSDGTVSNALPTIVIRDDDDVLAVYVAKGSPFKNNYAVPPDQRVASLATLVPSGQRPFLDSVWQNTMIRLYFEGRGFSVWALFDEQGAFASWYCNLEAPYVRTPIGIDTRDLALDIVADPARNWQWKDKDEFERRLELGIDTPAHQARVRAAASELIDRLEHNHSPFSDGWQDWRPPADWQIRSMPTNWQTDYGSDKPLSTALW